MKKIVTVLWHNVANRLKSIQNQTSEFVDLEIYSATNLSEGKESLDLLKKDMDGADMLLFYISSSDSVWPEVEKMAENISIPIIYIGSESVSHIKDISTIEICSNCNQYNSYAGSDNLLNMIKYLSNKVLDLEVAYEEPQFIPWEGIYHPDSKNSFSSVEEYFAFRPRSAKGVICMVSGRNQWLEADNAIETYMIRKIEACGYSVLPIFSYPWEDNALGAAGADAAIEKFCFDFNGNSIIDGLIRLVSFSVSNAATLYEAKEKSLMEKLNCPVIKPICSSRLYNEEWEADTLGTLSDVAWAIALPEFEGAVEPLFAGGIEYRNGCERRAPIESRCDRIVERTLNWAELRKKDNKNKKVVFILHNNPCASVEATVGGGANLDTLQSVADIMQVMKQVGYSLTNAPTSGKELIDEIMSRKAISEFRWTTVQEIINKNGALYELSKEEYLPWFNELPKRTQDEMTTAWGNPPGETVDDIPPAMLHDGKIVITGVSYDHALVCVQPKRGCAGPRCDGTVCKILHDPLVPPTHQFVATYKYFERIYKADVIIHVGTHGYVEFLPGRGTGLSDGCYPEICIGTMPHLYIYNSDNPAEGTVAKRRSAATIIDHMQTVMIPGGLYDELEELDQLMNRYEKIKTADKGQKHLLEHDIIDAIKTANLSQQISLEKYEEHYHEVFPEIEEAVHKALTVIKNTQIQKGQHIFGKLPEGEDRVDFLNSIVRFEGLDNGSLRSAITRLIGLDLQFLMQHSEGVNELYHKPNGTILFELDQISKEIISCFLNDQPVTMDLPSFAGYKVVNKGAWDQILAIRARILDIDERLQQSKEIDSLINGMNGAFIRPGPSGIVTRGRDDILPTGRNFYSLDPTMVPSKVAYEVGKRLGDRLIEKFMEEEGHYPENFALYWMTSDIVRTDGESLSQMLYLLGVRPKWESNGRVKGFSVVSLEELGRPRVDITVKLSGILRDSFQQCIQYLDDAVIAVANLDEPLEMNFIRKHALENMEASPDMTWQAATARLFGARPGTYNAGVNLMVYASAWKDQSDFTDIFTYFSGYVYGRDKYGEESFKELQNSLKTVDITYNKVESDEFDLLGCCGYFGNHGGLTAAARALSNKDVKTYYGDTREVTNVEIRTLADELRRVVRGKLLNPTWIEGQKQHGYKGAGDISKRVGRIYGWEATTDEVEDWIFDDITKTFIANEENRRFFMDNNPWALEEMARRLMEAYDRKLWNPQDGLIEEIKDCYLELEAFMENDMGENVGEFQGSSVDVIDINEIDFYKNKVKGMKNALK